MTHEPTLNYESPGSRSPRHSRLPPLALALGIFAIVLPGLCVGLMSISHTDGSSQNNLLVVVLVLLIVPAAIILGTIAVWGTRRSRGPVFGRGKAFLGLILSLLALLLYGVVGLFYFAYAMTRDG